MREGVAFTEIGIGQVRIEVNSVFISSKSFLMELERKEELISFV